MNLRSWSRKRWVRILIGVILILLSFIYLILPFGLGIFATFPRSQAVGDPPTGFEEITLTTQDGVELAAWYSPPSNGAVILVLHGAGGTRKGVSSQSQMLQEHGFGVLAFDLRGCGESDGQTNLFGWNGTQDVGAAIQFLESQPDVKAIGGLGISLGAEILLGASSAYPSLQAIASDGATFRTVEEYKALSANRSLYRNFTIRVLYFSVRLFSGDTPPKPLLDSMLGTDQTTFLFIAGGNDEQEVKFNQLFAENLGERAILWVVPEVGHTGAFGRYPDEYETQLIEFFEANLIDFAL